MRSEKRVNFGKRKALVFVALFAVLVSLSIGTASAATHYVHPGESIQDAIDAASSSDTIEVYSGTYYENVDVTKQLVLRGVQVRGSRSWTQVEMAVRSSCAQMEQCLRGLR